MTTKTKRKKSSPWTNEYTVKKVTRTGDEVEIFTVLGSRDAFHKQQFIEDGGFFAIVFNATEQVEEYRTPGCAK